MKEQTQFKLEYKLLYSLVVAGKSATFAENVMKKFLDIEHVDDLKKSPFDTVCQMVHLKDLRQTLHACRSGNYNKLAHAFEEVAFNKDLDLATCSPEELEKVKGIGPKTSRFFILWTRPDGKYAALDTHILKWLKYLGHDAPKSTPTGKKYRELELIFLDEADARAMTPAKLDEAIWCWCRENNGNNLDYSLNASWPMNLRRLVARRGILR